MASVRTTKPRPGLRINWMHPLTQGLRHWWLFHEGSGALAQDVVGQAHGALVGRPTWDGRRHGGSLTLDGTDDFANVGTQANFSGVASLSFWARSTTDSVRAAFALGVGAAADNHLFIYLGDGATGSLTNELITVARLSPGGNNWAVGYETATRTELFDGAWHHIVIVFRGGSTNAPLIYLDGVSRTVTVGDAGPPDYDYGVSGADYAYLGARRVNGTNSLFVNGGLDDVRLYTTAISQEMVTRLSRQPYGLVLSGRSVVFGGSIAPAAGGGIVRQMLAHHHFRGGMAA